jgi:hypothetical protein
MEEYEIIKKWKNGITATTGIKTKYATSIALLQELGKLKKGQKLTIEKVKNK